MNCQHIRWTLLPDQPGPQSLLHNELRLSPLVARLLVNRRVLTPEDARRFLSSTLEELRPPFSLKDVKRASRRIAEALYQKEPICIFGDYDADGITGTALLVLFLEALGARVNFYIPQRCDEGYGLNIPALEKIKALGTSLVITVDCGISDAEEVRFARDQGIDVIVTDHHEVPERIPEAAYAVINPKQSDCLFPFKYLAGVGVAFYLIIGLRKLLREEGFWTDGPPPNLKDYLDLVAIGTLADIAPLVDENRIFVKYGMEVLGKSARPGIIALKKVCGVENGTITPEAISYRLAPRLNASGRLSQAEKAVRLLITSDQAEADRIALELSEENSRRQQIEAAIFKEACHMVEAEGAPPHAIVLVSPDWHPGVIGISASRLVEQYYRPAILIALDGDIGHGSARSIEAFPIYEGLRHCEDLLVRFGGHGYAAGLTISRRNIDTLRQKLNALIASTLQPEDFIPKLYIDARMELSEITESLIAEIQALAPFGAGNPQPLFVSDTFSAGTPFVVGNGHMKMCLAVERTNLEVIGFGMEARIPPPNSSVQVVFVPEINVWQGSRKIQLTVKDLQVVEA